MSWWKYSQLSGRLPENDGSSSGVGAEGEAGAFFVLPFARATDADGDALDWSVSLSSDDYTGYGDDFDTASELSNLVDIYWNDGGSAGVLFLFEPIESFANDETEFQSKIQQDTWTFTVAVSDGNGDVDSTSISIEWPEYVPE